MGYARAYIVDDWMFTAHHCLEDGNTDEACQGVAGIELEESGRLARLSRFMSVDRPAPVRLWLETVMDSAGPVWPNRFP